MSGWITAGKILAVAGLFVTPFIVVVPEQYSPYLTAIATGLQAASVYCAHAENSNSANAKPS